MNHIEKNHQVRFLVAPSWQTPLVKYDYSLVFKEITRLGTVVVAKLFAQKLGYFGGIPFQNIYIKI